MSKLNIFRKEWLDVVFENRNKKYGAYQLRSDNPKTTSLALVAGMALFGLAISSPLILRGMDGTLGVHTRAPEIESGPVIWDVPTPAPPVNKVPEPEPMAGKPLKNETAAASSESSRRHVAYKVTDDHDKIVENVTAVAELTDVNPGSETRVGVPGGVINTDGSSVSGTGAIGGTPGGESSGNEIFNSVQFKAEPVGGFKSFNQQFVSRFKTPEMSVEIKKIQVIIKFIVEKDGSLSDIQLLRDPGYGAGKEALRVLSTMPKWKAAVQNNRKVRSQFTLPITIQIQ